MGAYQHSGHHTLLTQLLAHLRVPLYRNGYALLFSGIITSGLGMFYWMLATHAYSAEIVGMNSAAISVMMLLSGMSQMSMNSALIRFLGRAGSRSATLILGCYAVAGILTIITGLSYGLNIAYWTPALAVYFGGWAPILLFTLSIGGWTIYALQDSVLAGLRQSVWVPVENIVGAVLKIILLLALPVVLPVYGIFVAWMVPVVLLVPPVNYFIFRYLLPIHLQETAAQAEPIVWKLVARYVLGNYVGTLCFLGYSTVLPILVTVRAGASANAYFYMPWMLATALVLIGFSLTTSLTVEGTYDEKKLSLYCFQALRQTLLLVTPLVVLLWLSAPYLLYLFGADYALEGTKLLRLLAISTLPNTILMLYLSIARVQNNTRGVILSQGALCLSLLGLSYELLPQWGITGVGWASLISQSAVALLLLSLTSLRGILHQGWKLYHI